MEVAVATPKAVSFEELYNKYFEKFPPDSDVPNKSPERMVAYVKQPQLKKKWSQVKVFLMTHRYRSWDDAYLSFERVYRSIVNGTSLNLKKGEPLKKGPFWKKHTIKCKGCGFKAVFACNREEVWSVLEAGDLVQHAPECFGTPYQNSDLFMNYIRTLKDVGGYTELEAVLLKKYNTKLTAHSLCQASHSAKRKLEKTMTSEQANSFNKEKFERLFGTCGVLDGVSLGESICALFGLLTKFKEEDNGFDISISFDRGVLSFLGMLWSSQKAVLGLFGDLLIVDSIHGFTPYGYHVINVTLVDNTLHSQIGAIGLCLHDDTVSYTKLFEFVQSKVQFIRSPRALIADGAMQIHNAFDKVFGRSSHVFCSFHLREHIGKWFAGCKEKDALIELTMDGLYATNLESLRVTVEHIHELSSDVQPQVVAKVDKYLAEQAPCKQNFFTATSTASGRCEQENGVLRSLGFTATGGTVQALSSLRDKVVLQFQHYFDRTLKAVPTEWNFSSIVDESVLTTFTEAILKRFEGEYILSKRGYAITPPNGPIYKVTYNGDGKAHMPHTVSWCTSLNSLGVPIPTCTCSLHASGGHPCRHIIAVAAHREETVKASFFNDRFEKDQVPFTKGKAASVNYSVSTGAVAPRLDLVSGGNDKEEEEKEADPSASEKKVCMEKLLGWVKSMETESPDTPYPPQTGESNNSGAPSAKVQKLINFNESLNHAYEKDLTNGEVRQITRLVFNEIMSRVDPDNRAELLAEQVKLYKKFVARSKALSVGTTKGEPGRMKKVFPSFYNRK